MSSMYDEVQASELTNCQKEVTIKVSKEKGALTDLISAQLVTPSIETESPYVVATERLEERLYTKRLVQRECYDHLLPLIEAKLKEGNVSVEGTPGVGKTIFGLFLLRDFVLKKRSVVYWNGTLATFFTQSQRYIDLFGLNKSELLNGETWYWGAWDPELRALDELLLFDDIFVIHDPAENFTKGGTVPGAKNLVIILSFGHILVSKWATKLQGIPHFRATMPVFTYKEILDNKNNLFSEKELSDRKLEDLYQRFGGSVRHYGQSSEVSAWEELKAKMLDVARNGSYITARTTNHKGSIVYVSVEFDATRNKYPGEGHNTFQPEGYAIGSADLTKQLSTALAQCGKDQLRKFMNGIQGQKGAEAMYGILFEKHAHEVLCRPEVNLNLKVVRRDGKNKYGYTTIKIQVDGERDTLEFDGQEAAGINEMVGETKPSPDTYFLPSSSTFPTYDSAVVVPGEVVGLPSYGRVGLLLQMTVSGATDILRRPEHAVKYYMRKQMHSALEKPEEVKSSTEPVKPENQAEFQFVIEIPEFLQLPVSELSKDQIHGKSGRVHRYELRTERPKRLKVNEVLET